MARRYGSISAFALCPALLFLIGVMPGESAAAVRESVEQFDSGGSLVTVECFAPTARGKHPLVLLLHGSGGLEQATGEVFQGIARKMAARVYVVLIPHLFDRKGGPKEWVQVVDDAIAFAAGGGVEGIAVDPERIGLFGFSMGSSLAFHRASRPERPGRRGGLGPRAGGSELEDPARPRPLRIAGSRRTEGQAQRRRGGDEGQGHSLHHSRLSLPRP